MVINSPERAIPSPAIRHGHGQESGEFCASTPAPGFASSILSMSTASSAPISNILPKDASSLIRLLGRNIAHDAMLKFFRRYYRNIITNGVEKTSLPRFSFGRSVQNQAR
mmetsp:Transcript_15124/g.27339  ORF Transcript_15124/g.27339 Transcript_15124/m.27339 type:complete len:110 (-) Transcript_15124:70-399(-)